MTRRRGETSSLDESTQLLELARSDTALGGGSHHLATRIATLNYIRMADEIARRKDHDPFHLLDWGSGYGHMSYLLRNRGFSVTSFEVGHCPRWKVEHSFLEAEPKVLGHSGGPLPFDRATFDGALSCGVLEHVPDDRSSLIELARVLRPGGFLFITMLPNAWSVVEWINRRRGTSDHQILYTPERIRRLLEETGYEVVDWSYGNLVPKNLTGFPRAAKRAYDALAKVLLKLETPLLQLPPINRISGTLELVARRRTDA